MQFEHKAIRATHQRRAPGRHRKAAAAWLLALTTSMPVTPLSAQTASCGNPFVSKVGPYDYRVERGHQKFLVESYHFTPSVEALIHGESASLGADLDYTLNAFPNHHRALVAMMNLGVKLKSPQPDGAKFGIECYFVRALQFRPDDTIARMLYGKFLASQSRKSEANAQLQLADDSAKDDGFSHYNLGLLYLEMSEYDRALAQAHKAMALGFGRTELKQRLVAAGRWVEPPTAPVGATSASAAASQTN